MSRPRASSALPLAQQTVLLAAQCHARTSDEKPSPFLSVVAAEEPWWWCGFSHKGLAQESLHIRGRDCQRRAASRLGNKEAPVGS